MYSISTRSLRPQWIETKDSGDALQYPAEPLDEFRALVEERGKFIMIPSEEISDRAEGVPVHINASNLREVIDPLGGATVRETIENNLRSVYEQSAKAARNTGPPQPPELWLRDHRRGYCARGDRSLLRGL